MIKCTGTPTDTTTKIQYESTQFYLEKNSGDNWYGKAGTVISSQHIWSTQIMYQQYVNFIAIYFNTIEIRNKLKITFIIEYKYLDNNFITH